MAACRAWCWTQREAAAVAAAAVAAVVGLRQEGVASGQGCCAHLPSCRRCLSRTIKNDPRGWLVGDGHVWRS